MNPNIPRSLLSSSWCPLRYFAALLVVLFIASVAAAETALDLSGWRAADTSLLQLAEEITQDNVIDTQELDQLTEALTKLDARLAPLISPTETIDSSDVPMPPAWLTADELPNAVSGAMALRVARELSLLRLYEESLTWLKLVQPKSEAFLPLALYYQAIAHHQLAQIDQAKTAAGELLTHETLSARQRQLAELILHDTKAVDEKSVGYASRLMNDVGRRLDLGRTGEPEQKLQEEILALLDKKIEEMEEKQRQQQEQQQAASQPMPSAKPMQESKPGDLKGPGEIDKRQIADGGNWGDLPPKERERVTQQLGRDFPAYYRDVIEQYFRTLADPPADIQMLDSEKPTEGSTKGSTP